MKNKHFYFSEKMRFPEWVLNGCLIFLVFWLRFILGSMQYNENRAEFEIIHIVCAYVMVGYGSGLLIKSIRFLKFKKYKNRVIDNGKLCRGIVLYSIKGENANSLKYQMVNRFAYYPVVNAYIDGREVILESKYSIYEYDVYKLNDNNNVNLMVYGTDFIILEVCADKEFIADIRYKRFDNEAIHKAARKNENMYPIIVATGISLIMAVGIIVRLLNVMVW